MREVDGGGGGDSGGGGEEEGLSITATPKLRARSPEVQT